MTDIRNVLAPDELQRCVSILQGAANVDASPEVRKLSGHLMAILQQH